jgi:hypothetical protein
MKMKYERFEDLPVWKDAIELSVRVYTLTKDRFFNQPGDLRGQLRRASLSVSNNIAEGFERGTTAELLAFLYISRLLRRNPLDADFYRTLRRSRSSKI